jgi:hypothetical protein
MPKTRRWDTNGTIDDEISDVLGDRRRADQLADQRLRCVADTGSHDVSPGLAVNIVLRRMRLSRGRTHTVRAGPQTALFDGVPLK